MSTEATDAAVATMRLFSRYRSRGMVFHMSMKGATVRWLGSQRKAPCTSLSGLSDAESMT